MSLRSVMVGSVLAATMLSATSVGAVQSPEEDRRTVAALDIEFQAAVKHNDFATMDRILHPGFVLALGDGTAITREALLARERHITYEQQDEEPGTQTVRVYGDTAVVTAKIWLKGVGPRGAFDRKLWFSDTYVRTDNGWRYAFAQASLQLPPE